MDTLIVEPADAPNPAKAQRFAIGCHWRGVGDPGRCAVSKMTMRILGLIPLLFLLGCSREDTTAIKATADTNTPTVIEPPPVAAPSEKTLPTWYVFRVKAFHTVTYSDDRTSAVVEGVTMKDKDFKVKVAWDARFEGNHQRCVDEWLKRSKADFEAGLPYIIAGEVIGRDPLTIRPDTVVDKAPNWGAPPENEY